MIQKTKLNSIATYTNPLLIRPLKINFCYGSNGSGKTTLSDLLGGYETSAACSVTWERVQYHHIQYTPKNTGILFQCNWRFEI